jgi:type II secretory pathway component PulF
VSLALLPLVVGAWARRWARQRTRWGILDHLAFLAQRGFPLRGGLEVLEREWDGTPGREVELIRRKLQASGSLAEALGERPKLFDENLRELVRAGEQGGALPQTLAVAAAELDPARSTVKEPERLIYPVALCTAVVIGATFLGEVISPKLRSISSSMGTDAPLDPLGLPFQAFMGVIVLALGAVLAVQIEGAPRRAVLWLARGIPLLRGALEARGRARSLRQAGALLGAGVPLPLALRSAPRLSGAVSLDDAAALAEQGGALPQVLGAALGSRAPTLLPRLLLLVDSLGLPATLGRAADMLSDRAEREQGWLVSLIEPLPILAAGGMVLALALSAFGFTSEVHGALIRAMEEAW